MGNSAIYIGLMRPSALQENNNKIKRVCNNSTIKLTRGVITMFIWLFGRFLFNRNGLYWISKTKQGCESSGLMILLIILIHIALNRCRSFCNHNNSSARINKHWVDINLCSKVSREDQSVYECVKSETIPTAFAQCASGTNRTIYFKSFFSTDFLPVGLPDVDGLLIYIFVF